MKSKNLLIEIDSFVATITLNRPETLNALTIELRHELGLLINELNEADAVRVIILTGAGQKAFSAGLDLMELSENEDTLKIIYDDPIFCDPIKSIRSLKKPINYQTLLSLWTPFKALVPP